MELNELLVLIDGRKAEIAGLPPLTPDVERRLRERLQVEWTYHSNAIEGNALTLGETRFLLLEGLMPKGSKRVRHADDLRGHGQAVKAMEALVATRNPLTAGVLSQWHTLLLREEYDLEGLTEEGGIATQRVVPGQWRTTPAFVRKSGGDIVQYPVPADIEGRLAKLLSWHAKGSEALHPVLGAARLHHQFLALHPFQDGNGRLARLLMNFELLRHGFPPVVIAKEARRSYLKARQNADGGNTEEWDVFIAQHVLEAQALYLRAARGQSFDDMDDVDKALLQLKQELAGVEEPQELNQERFTRVLIGTIGPLLIRLVEKLRQFDELYSSEKLTLACQIFSDGTLKAAVPGPALSGRKSHAKKWVAEFPASMMMQELEVSVAWEGFRKGGLNDFGTSLTIRFLFERRKFHVQCESLPFSLQLMYQEKFPEDELRLFLNDVAKYILCQIQIELDRQKR